ncbi:MAG: DUF1838 domain-containing protein [Nodosilinea sp. WJT8-NPBG4]|nr:DUF1838 domain-containing protein [Nodosilinea sp. WJT8-NPBG4]
MLSKLLGLMVGLWTATTGPGAAIATPLDLDRPEDALQVFRKLLCSVEDGKTVYFVWQGKVFSRRPGEADRHLFNVQGVSTRACTSLTSETGAPGFRQVTREVMIYLDPETNALLTTWENPWTGETTTVHPVANDPVNSSPFWADTTGQHLQFQNFGDTDLLFFTVTLPLFYADPLGGNYQDYVGGHYHAMEMFTFSARRSHLLASADQDIDDIAVSWSRISPWLPWMKMGGHPGELVVHAAGTRVGAWQQLPEPLRSQIADNFALYQTPPPLDDNRPNETTWTNFRDSLNGQP